MASKLGIDLEGKFKGLVRYLIWELKIGGKLDVCLFDCWHLIGRRGLKSLRQGGAGAGAGHVAADC
jgi:hypothetical protein